ncbi:MAG: MFS transporter [Roseobacter sp.]
MNRDEDRGWRAIVGSSSIMSLALLGDALLYAVLPAYAPEFGLTLPWVGVMLSANRFIRVLAYRAIARLATSVSLRKICLWAAITATVSTAAYGVVEGPALMLGARIVWGLTYASLVLATLSYAVEFRDKVGTRVGVGQAIQRVGPILALFGGAWLVGQAGPQMAFAVLAVPTALGILIALRLPRAVSPPKTRSRPPALARPKPIDVLFFLQGYGVDGVFAITITLIFARNTDLSTAVMSGSALLAMRHFGEAIAAPLFGAIADKFGARKVFIVAAVLTMVGFVLVAAGITVIGALVMLLFRGALASLGPALIAADLHVEQDAIGPLARMQAWRDLGAALGPLVTGFALAYLSAEAQHGLVACALAFGMLYWVTARD